MNEETTAGEEAGAIHESSLQLASAKGRRIRRVRENMGFSARRNP
jgi:hypothetical protein